MEMEQTGGIKKEPFRIKQAEFITSVGASTSAYPAPLLAEIAIVGKSNVGKSSLINSLCNNKKLAKTSQNPGKTRLINFFKINREFFLVDLPGYGFAKASKTEQQAWGELMETYLASARVNHLFLLVDIRHEPSAEDRQMYEWMLYYSIPFTLVATKADKIARSKRQQAANAVAKALGAPPPAMMYSSTEKIGHDAILLRIGQVLDDYRPTV
ncbi:ribosome biogenesis GTP-binding protein YihA/YsxC [Christensenellaceae bacterium OttesenSCG-928-M15]|nr:ribosome biogenesis GTP-binding protein YihA/YsxC [Christensenellaceae bacterium OttesenSCG-928-M15]